ncbi:MAG TPA: diphthine--ammonia ligase [Candidatus Methylomirabilis sp.]|nr:diphthine--ammonia ligase [Candidatus Methylomirabilis sp.]
MSTRDLRPRDHTEAAKREPVLFCWSGGKDSAMALHALLQRSDIQITALLTTVTEKYDRISMHGVRRELLKRQTESIGLPLHEVLIPPQCINPVYEARMEAALRAHYDKGVRTVAFGDIFLEDLRAYRERNLARVGMTALFPIWKRDTRELVRAFRSAKFRAIAACVDSKVLDRSFAGRELDEAFFRDLPPHADPCGENGEFHTFVFDGPIFRTAIPVRNGEIAERDSFVFCDLLPVEEEGNERETIQ